VARFGLGVRPQLWPAAYVVSQMRRATLLGCALALLLALVASVSTLGAAPDRVQRPAPPTSGEVERATRDFLAANGGSEARAKAARASTAGDRIFPNRRLVTLYGAPQLTKSIIGLKSVNGAKKKLNKEVSKYEQKGDEPVTGGFDLIATLATSTPGSAGLFRDRQRDSVIQTYLDAARAVNGRLLLDIQPGRSTFLKEAKAYRDWLVKPDVDLALDPEWNVGKKGKPGQTEGKVSAANLNKVSDFLAGLVRSNDLPQKVMVVHQFRKGSIRHRDEIEQRGDDVAVTLNFDGIGGRKAKEAGYLNLRADQLFDGFSLFYRLDKGLMSPGQVLGLDPSPNYVMYQ
jgi:hypothetical protein